jgi:hypothetical protein
MCCCSKMCLSGFGYLIVLPGGVDDSMIDLILSPMCRRVQRNSDGGFFQIFQHNKWRIRKEREAEEGCAAMAVC